MSEQPTLNDVAERLASLSRDLGKATDEAERLDRSAVEARHAFESAYSLEFLRAEGSMDVRKHTAIIETAEKKLAAEIAEQTLRACRTRIATIKTQIDVGRSLGAAIKADVALAGSGAMP